MDQNRAPAWAVVVGVNKFEDEFNHPPLRCCVSDAIGMFFVLTHRALCNIAPEHVTLCIDCDDTELKQLALEEIRRLESEYRVSVAPGALAELFDRRRTADREGILSVVNTAADNAGPEDAVLVCCSSHGRVYDGEIYLVCPKSRGSLYDMTAISIRNLRRLLSTSRAHSKLMILDLCYSGSANNLDNRGLLKLLSSRQVGIVSSTRPWELAAEHDRCRHGVFTNFLIEALVAPAVDGRARSITLETAFKDTERGITDYLAAAPLGGPTQRPTMNRAAKRVAPTLVLSGVNALNAPSGSRIGRWMWLVAAGILLVFGLTWAVTKPQSLRPPPTPRELALSVKITRPGGNVEHASSLDAIKVGSEDSIHLRFSSVSGGYLFVINESPPGAPGVDPTFVVLFPSKTSNNWSAAIPKDGIVQVPEHEAGLVLDQSSTTEYLWLVWSTSILPDLESVRTIANEKDHGLVTSIPIARSLAKFLHTTGPTVRPVWNQLTAQWKFRSTGDVVISRMSFIR